MPSLPAAAPPNRAATAYAGPERRRQRMPETGLVFADGDAARFRTLQADGHKYPINLEQVYRNCLNAIAADRGMRVNRLVHEIAQQSRDADGDRDAASRSLAGRLRLFCLRELRGRLIEAQLRARHSSLAAAIVASPVPGLVISRQHVVVFVNPAYRAWAAPALREVVGRPFEALFRLYLGGPLDKVFAALETDPQPVRSGSIAAVVPGRAQVWACTVCLLDWQADEQPGLLIYIQQR